jgi:hypothetical protein
MRVFLYYPARRTPGGGHKHLRLLAQNIRRLGIDSFLLREDSKCNDVGFYGIDVPASDFGLEDAASHLTSEDLVFLPEYRLDALVQVSSGWSSRKAVYAQGGFLALLHRPPGGYWRHAIEFMIGVSPYIVALGPAYLGLPAARCFYVPYPVVRGPFAEVCRTFEAKRLAISFMPRKLPDHVREVRREVEARCPQVPWVEIDGCPEREVAQRLDENALFFSTQDGEGFGLPAIEAMARGALVTGYRGTGGFPAPYATPRNGLWAPDRSPRRAVSRVLAGVELARHGGPALDAVLTASRETLAGFTEECALAALGEVLRSAKSGEFPRRSHAPRLGIRGHLQAWRCVLRAPAILRRSREAAEAQRTAARR